MLVGSSNYALPQCSKSQKSKNEKVLTLIGGTHGSAGRSKISPTLNLIMAGDTNSSNMERYSST